MKAQGEDAFATYVATTWTSDEASYSSMDYEGYYLLTNKDIETYGGVNNALYLVFKIQSSLEATNSSGTETFSANPEFYWYIEYTDLIVGKDGEIIFDVNSYNTPKDEFKVEATNILSWGVPRKWTYKGYETMDELTYAVVTSNREAYNCEEDFAE